MTDMDFVAEYLCLRFHKQVRAVYSKVLVLITPEFPNNKLRNVFMCMDNSDTIETMIIRWNV